MENKMIIIIICSKEPHKINYNNFFGCSRKKNWLSKLFQRKSRSFNLFAMLVWGYVSVRVFFCCCCIADAFDWRTFRQNDLSWFWTDEKKNPTQTHTVVMINECLIDIMAIHNLINYSSMNFQFNQCFIIPSI